jgi:sugar phosphate isomerase/epimerase
MHVGIFAKTFVRPTLEETLDAVVRHGLTHVQFNMSCAGLPTLPERVDEKLCRWIAQSLRDRGLTMAAISGTFNLCGPDPLRLEDNLRRLEVLAAACRWLDTRIITLCTGTWDPEDMWKWHPANVRRLTWEMMIQSVKKAVRIADRYEVTLAFEPEMHNIVNSVSKARRLLDEINSPWLKVVIDPANLIPAGDMRRMSEILNEAFDWLGPDIVLAHAKNPGNTVDAEQMLSLNRVATKFTNTPRAGQLPGRANEPISEDLDLYLFYCDYLAWLKKIRFGGTVIVHGLAECFVPEMTRFLKSEVSLLERS